MVDFSLFGYAASATYRNRSNAGSQRFADVIGMFSYVLISTANATDAFENYIAPLWVAELQKPEARSDNSQPSGTRSLSDSSGSHALTNRSPSLHIETPPPCATIPDRRRSPIGPLL